MIDRYAKNMVFILAGLLSCVKPYEFDSNAFEKVLVIDALVTDQPGPYEVSISYTYPLDTVVNDFEPNAAVWVETGKGARIDYTWSDNGTYRSPSSFRGEPSETYQLFVELPDGSSYQSSVETLSPSVPIQDIYSQYAELPDRDGGQIVGGIQFFIDTADPTEQAKFFRYEWEEAYQINTPYPARFEVRLDSTIVPLEEEIGICYQENASKGLLFGSTLGNDENRLIEFPVRFISDQLYAQQLRVRYTLLVKQYAITESAYLFYKRLEENNDSGGSLFDQQVGSIYGNMSSVTNPDEGVLGFFEVSGVSYRREFFNPEELDPRYSLPPYLYFCGTEYIIETTPDSALFYAPPQSSYNIYGYNISPPPTVFIHTQVCTDCSFYADTTPPSYWIP